MEDPVNLTLRQEPEEHRLHYSCSAAFQFLNTALRDNTFRTRDYQICLRGVDYSNVYCATIVTANAYCDQKPYYKTQYYRNVKNHVLTSSSIQRNIEHHPVLTVQFNSNNEKAKRDHNHTIILGTVGAPHKFR